VNLLLTGDTPDVPLLIAIGGGVSSPGAFLTMLHTN
jgi:hypothetical protein